MKFSRKKLVLSMALLGLTSTVSMAVYAGKALPAVPLSWTAGTAVVDGNTSEWNLSTDAATRMCEAGSINPDGTCNGKEQLSTVYTRYNCNTNTMYVLVLKAAGHTADQSASWVKVYDLSQSPQVQGPSNSANFHDVTVGGVVQGYEASFSLAAGTYNSAEIHIEIDGSRTSSTAKIDYTRSITVPENCTVPALPAAQTITFGALATKISTDAPFTVSATASSGLPVSYSSTGNCTMSGNTVTLTGAGSCTVTASQAGNTSYSAATSVSQTFAINAPPVPTSGTVGGYNGFDSWGQCQSIMSGGTTLSVVGRLLPAAGVSYNSSTVTGEVYNNSNTPQTVTLVSYKEFYADTNFDDQTVNGVLVPGQRVNDYQTVSVPAKGHVTLTAQLPGCSTQIDLVCADVIQYLGGGNLYGARKLAYYHAHQPSNGWCNSTGVTSWNGAFEAAAQAAADKAAADAAAKAAADAAAKAAADKAAADAAAKAAADAAAKAAADKAAADAAAKAAADKAAADAAAQAAADAAAKAAADAKAAKDAADAEAKKQAEEAAAAKAAKDAADAEAKKQADEAAAAKAAKDAADAEAKKQADEAAAAAKAVADAAEANAKKQAEEAAAAAKAAKDAKDAEDAKAAEAKKQAEEAAAAAKAAEDAKAASEAADKAAKEAKAADDKKRADEAAAAAQAEEEAKATEAKKQAEEAEAAAKAAKEAKDAEDAKAAEAKKQAEEAATATKTAEEAKVGEDAADKTAKEVADKSNENSANDSENGKGHDPITICHNRAHNPVIITIDDDGIGGSFKDKLAGHGLTETDTVPVNPSPVPGGGHEGDFVVTDENRDLCVAIPEVEETCTEMPDVAIPVTADNADEFVDPKGNGNSANNDANGKGHLPVAVCHNVPHNPHIIVIDDSALQAHLKHLGRTDFVVATDADRAKCGDGKVYSCQSLVLTGNFYEGDICSYFKSGNVANAGDVAVPGVVHASYPDGSDASGVTVTISSDNAEVICAGGEMSGSCDFVTDAGGNIDFSMVASWPGVKIPADVKDSVKGMVKDGKTGAEIADYLRGTGLSQDGNYAVSAEGGGDAINLEKSLNWNSAMVSSVNMKNGQFDVIGMTEGCTLTLSNGRHTRESGE